MVKKQPAIRLTKQRQVILETLKSDYSHPTADEVYEKVRHQLPKISLATVYRNLEILAETGLIQELDPGRKQMRFDPNTHAHYHLTCVRCGRVEDMAGDISESPMKNIEKALGRLTKYGIFGHKLEFVGLCSKCMEAGYTLPEELTVNPGNRKEG
ncbi:MAG: transcriptional repressor [Deltaproteobacteria bacterium]|nr:transcriptional repressor [Deltaproteobacteria bacterium]